MSTSAQLTASNPSDPSSASPSRFVDPEDLICPGCGEQVRCAPPESGRDGHTEPAAEFSHLDRSELCRTPAGQLGEPIEVVR